MKETKPHPLRVERLRKGGTQQQLADFAVVSLSSVQRAERGEPLRVDISQRLCTALGKARPEELGYKGSCFKRLYCPGDDRAKAYLVDAQRTLTRALEHLAPTKLQRRSVLALDLASVCANQGAVEAACKHAARALSITTQTQSQTVLQRLFVLRQELEPWKDTPDVKNLDGLIRPLLISALRFPA
jgi:transcriptional regulator with XRE-family HTH domain